MKKFGFTLIELMIVVAIIALLASIAIPRYFKYYAKARQAEVAMILASLHTAEQAYFAEHGTYSAELSGQNGVGWAPEGYNNGGQNQNSSFNYSYGFFMSGAQEGVHFFTGKLGAGKEGLSNCYASKDGFLAMAVADTNGDGKLDVWSIDQSRTIKHEQNGID